MSDYIQEKRICGNCHATGRVPGLLWDRRCPVCHGAGSMLFNYDPAIPKDAIDRLRAMWTWPKPPATFLESITGGLFG